MACKVFVGGAHGAGDHFLVERKSKIRLLNKLLASAARYGADGSFLDAARGVSKALEDGCDDTPLEDFAKKILSLYDSDAHVEVLDFGGGHFDPLFAFPEINSAVRRLSGYDKAILVVSGLRDAAAAAKGRAVKRKTDEYFQNMEFVEDSVLSRSAPGANLEIFFI